MMVKYEIKKIFSRTINKIAIILLLFVLVLNCWVTMDVSFVNEQGMTEHGYLAVKQLRAAKKEWKGLLDEEKLSTILAENIRINATKEAQSNDYTENDIAFGWKQGYMDIRQLLNLSFESYFKAYDYYRADSLSPDDAHLFYQNRISLLQDYLYGSGNDQFSEAEKSYLLSKYEALETPFWYDYADGWKRLSENVVTLMLIIILILGFLLSGIFSGEFSFKADSIFYASYYGRNRAIKAKIKAGICIAGVLYWGVILLYSGIVLLYLGADGINCPIQTDYSKWNCFYNITLGQGYLLIVLGGFVGCLFLSILTMFVSSKTKSAVLAVIVPFILIFLPPFIWGAGNISINKLFNLMPDRLLRFHHVFNYFELYNIMGKVIGSIPILFVLYSVLSVIFIPVIYQVYRKKQIV